MSDQLPGQERLSPEQKWQRIHDAWVLYCERGASAFDWDYASRDLMSALTGRYAFEWARDSTLEPGDHHPPAVGPPLTIDRTRSIPLDFDEGQAS